MGNSSQNEQENRSIDIGGNEIKGSGYTEILKGSGYTEGDTYYIEKIVLPAIAASDRSKSEKILLQQVGAEIASRLKQSLHKQIFINLAKEDRPDRVRRPWDYEVKVGSQEREKLSPETTILQVHGVTRG